jgi:hypothetical protein
MEIVVNAGELGGDINFASLIRGITINRLLFQVPINEGGEMSDHC